MPRVYERLGSHVLPRELEIEDTPQYDPYENEAENKQTFPKLTDELKPTLEVDDHYVGAKILLP